MEYENLIQKSSNLELNDSITNYDGWGAQQNPPMVVLAYTSHTPSFPWKGSAMQSIWEKRGGSQRPPFFPILIARHHLANKI